jgi:hypothetical protein
VCRRFESCRAHPGRSIERPDRAKCPDLELRSRSGGSCVDTSRAPRPRRLHTGLGRQSARADGCGEGFVVPFVLVGVCGGEVGDRPFEGIAAAEVGRDRDPVAPAGVRPGQCRGAKARIDGGAADAQVLYLRAALPVTASVQLTAPTRSSASAVVDQLYSAGRTLPLKRHRAAARRHGTDAPDNRWSHLARVMPAGEQRANPRAHGCVPYQGGHSRPLLGCPDRRLWRLGLVIELRIRRRHTPHPHPRRRRRPRRMRPSLGPTMCARHRRSRRNPYGTWARHCRSIPPARRHRWIRPGRRSATASRPCSRAR